MNRCQKIDEVSITKLTLLAGELGYVVVFKNNETIKDSLGVVSFKKATITLYEHLQSDEKVFILLHEIGHIFAEEKTINPLFFLQEADKTQKIAGKKKISSITEEVLAWYYGVLIADLLGINVRGKVNKCLVRSLDSYLNFYNGKKNARSKNK